MSEEFESKYRPKLPPPMRSVGVVRGITVDQACIAFPKYRLLFSESPRGVLVDNPAALATFELARKLGCYSFTLFYNLEDGTFFCVTRGPGKLDACFTTGKAMPTYQPISSILGETTMEGVMRVLSIPRRLLLPE
ncbi:MAG TPA: hypothetical protein VNO30_21015 [Kofleriaceae bacterium]|nr:hypothetical protein [Kofleriaceae bacterium]